MSAKLDEFFKKYSIDEISKRTKISPISLNYIKNREFDKLNKVKLKGFIKLIEREFKVSLLDDVMKEYEEYYQSQAPKQEEPKKEIQENKNIYFKILAVVALIIGGGILYILQKPKQSNTTQLTKPPYTTQLTKPTYQTPINTSKETTKEINLTDNNLTHKKETKKEENVTTPQIFNLKTNQTLQQKELPKSKIKQEKNQKSKQQSQTNQNKPTHQKENKTKIKKENKQKTETKIQKNIQQKSNKQTPTQKQKSKPQQEITKTNQKPKQKTTQKPKKETIQPQKTKQENKEVKQLQKTTQKTTTQNKPIKIVPLMKTWIKIINLKTNESKFIITDKPLTLPYGNYNIQFGFAKAKIYYNDKVINLNKDLIGEVILKNGKYIIK